MRKAQSTLEFLLTYGWTLLAVLTIIGLLVYFGVMNPKNFLGEQCIVNNAFNCQGKALSNTTHSMIVFVNKMNYAYNLSSANTVLSSGCSAIEFCDKSGNNCESSKIIAINSEFMAKLRCDNSGSRRVKHEFTIQFTNPISGLTEDTKIYIISNVI